MPAVTQFWDVPRACCSSRVTDCYTTSLCFSTSVVPRGSPGSHGDMCPLPSSIPLSAAGRQRKGIPCPDAHLPHGPFPFLSLRAVLGKHQGSRAFSAYTGYRESLSGIREGNMSVYTCMDCCIISAVSPVLKGSKIMGRGTAVGCGEGGQRENTSSGRTG